MFPSVSSSCSPAAAQPSPPRCVLISAAAARTGGGYLPIISYWYKLQGGSTNGCACDEPRKPCPSGAHAGHTFCPSNPAPGQCDTLCDNSTASGSATEAGWIEVGKTARRRLSSLGSVLTPMRCAAVHGCARRGHARLHGAGRILPRPKDRGQRHRRGVQVLRELRMYATGPLSLSSLCSRPLNRLKKLAVCRHGGGLPGPGSGTRERRAAQFDHRGRVLRQRPGAGPSSPLNPSASLLAPTRTVCSAGTHSHWRTGADCCLGFRGQRAWWASELQREGLMSLDLPSHPATTDGTTLRHMATHGIIRESHAPLCAL